MSRSHFPDATIEVSVPAYARAVGAKNEPPWYRLPGNNHPYVAVHNAMARCLATYLLKVGSPEGRDVNNISSAFPLKPFPLYSDSLHTLSAGGFFGPGECQGPGTASKGDGRGQPEGGRTKYRPYSPIQSHIGARTKG